MEINSGGSCTRAPKSRWMGDEQGGDRGGESAASDAGGTVAKKAIVAAAKAAPKGVAEKA